ncbi:MAG: hypothetical protein LKM39_01650 [Chiayiivirga sp.]|jgi:hypothetical protein|nr:hypothetical protein [Chiayiivirga sp.]
MATNPFDQFDAPASATNPFDQFDAPVAPTRTWGQVLADRAMGVGAAGLDMIGSAVNTANTKTPWDNIPGGATAFSALETGAGLMGAAAGMLPQGVNDRVGAMRQYLAESRAADPESQQPRSEFAQSFANTSGQYADAARSIQSEKEKATQQRMAEVSKEGFLPTVAELATNPSALATATDSLIPSLAAGGGAGRLAGGLMGAKAAGQTAAQIGTMSAIEGAGSGDGAYEAVMQAAPDVLAADPVYQRLLDLYEGDDTKARETLGQMARSASTVSGTASAALLQGIGQRLGLNVAEDTLLGRITAGQTGLAHRQRRLGRRQGIRGRSHARCGKPAIAERGHHTGGAESDVMAGVGGAAALEGMGWAWEWPDCRGATDAAPHAPNPHRSRLTMPPKTRWRTRALPTRHNPPAPAARRAHSAACCVWWRHRHRGRDRLAARARDPAQASRRPCRTTRGDL